MADLSGVHNEASGGLRGPVVQAGSIDHLSLSGPAHVESDQAELLPRQLPLAIRDFTGRAEQVTELDALLADNAGADTGAVVISAVDGTAGIGKTTLAVWWAHRVQDRFPHGTLYANLRGYGPDDPATASEVLDGFLRGLGIPGGAIPHGVDAQAGLFRSVLAGRQVLIELDNAHSADQVRPLLPGTPGCVVVVTSRDGLTGLVITEGAHRLTLDLLTPDEAHDLVASIVGPRRAAAEPDAVATLIRLCVRLPLALRIAASRAAAPHTIIAAVVAELADERYRLDALSWGEDKTNCAAGGVRLVLPTPRSRASPPVPPLGPAPRPRDQRTRRGGPGRRGPGRGAPTVGRARRGPSNPTDRDGSLPIPRSAARLRHPPGPPRP